MSEIFVGTSGWAYNWNKGNSLDWYIKESKLNSVELNMSFYRFPYKNMIKTWSLKGNDLTWIIKVHRSITHFKRLNKESYEIFNRFKKFFSLLEDNIHYYLFQLPPTFIDIDKVENFLDEFGNEKVAIEYRHPSLFTNEIIDWGKKHNVLLVSVDAPKIPKIIMSKNIIYERIHGRLDWYSYNYSNSELNEIRDRILKYKSKKLYVFFNNDAMLKNAINMFKLLNL